MHVAYKLLKCDNMRYVIAIRISHSKKKATSADEFVFIYTFFINEYLLKKHESHLFHIILKPINETAYVPSFSSENNDKCNNYLLIQWFHFSKDQNLGLQKHILSMFPLLKNTKNE